MGKEEEIVQESVKTELRKVDEGFDGFGNAVESPRSYGEAKWKDLEDLNQAIHHECQVKVARPLHRDMVECILEVYRTAPHGLHYTIGNVGDCLHFERRFDEDFVEG